MKKTLALILALAMVMSFMCITAFAEETELTYWSYWESTEPQAQVIQEAANAFYAEKGIKVNIEFMGRSGVRNGIEPAIDAGTVIDLFDDNYDRSNGQWTKFTNELEELVKKYNYEETAIPAVIAGCRSTSGGILHAIPYQPSVYAFVYNTEIFAEAGVEKIPETWTEFLEVCEKVKAAGYTPCTSDDAYILNYLGHYYGRLAGQDEVIDTVKNGGWSTKAEAIQTAKAFEEMASKGYFSEFISSNVYPAAQNGEFALGETAMIFCGSFLPNEIKTIAGEDYVWGAFAFPLVEGGVSGFECANLSSSCFNIPTTSEHVEEAFQFIVYLTKGEWDYKLSQESIGVPADTTNGDWPAQLANFKIVFDAASTRWESAVGTKLNADVQPILKENFIKLCAGQITAEEFGLAVDAAY